MKNKLIGGAILYCFMLSCNGFYTGYNIVNKSPYEIIAIYRYKNIDSSVRMRKFFDNDVNEFYNFYKSYAKSGDTLSQSFEISFIKEMDYNFDMFIFRRDTNQSYDKFIYFDSLISNHNFIFAKSIRNKKEFKEIEDDYLCFKDSFLELTSD